MIPANASEFYTLSDDERIRLVERTSAAVAGAVPLVVGVQAATARAAVRFAEHAARQRADAVMAMPPLLRTAAAPSVRDYYRRIAEVGLDTIVQNAPGPMGTPQASSALAALLASHERIRYLKEEVPPILHRVSAALEAAGSDCDGVFGGANGTIMVEELDRGSCGNMPAGGVVDVQVQLFNAYEGGDRERALAIQSRLMPLLFHATTYGVSLHKYLLWRRGVLRTPASRDPEAIHLDEDDKTTIAERFAAIADLVDPATPLA